MFFVVTKCCLRIVVYVALAAIAPSALAQSQSQPDTDRDAREARATELLTQARLALGGEQVLRKIQTLSAEIKLRRHVKYLSVQSPKKVVEKHDVISGKIELDFQLPDKFRRRVKSRDWRGFPYSYAEVVNGAEAWRNPALPARASGREQRVIDVNDFERNLDRQAWGARQQSAFYAFGWLLQELPWLPMQFSYAGELPFEDRIVPGVLISGAGDFNAVMVFDAQKHLPLALIAAGGALSRMPVLIEAVSFDRRYMGEIFARARREREAIARTRPAQRSEIRWVLSDHRPVAGVLLPHRIVVMINGEVVEEMTVEKFEINRPINPNRFTDKPKEFQK